MEASWVTGSEESVQERPRVGGVDPLVAAGGVAGQRVHVRRVADEIFPEERRSAGAAETGSAAGLRVVGVDLEDDDLGLHVLEEGRGRAPLCYDDLRLLVADLDAVADECEGPVLEYALVGVESADGQQRCGRDAGPLGRGRF